MHPMKPFTINRVCVYCELAIAAAVAVMIFICLIC